VRIVVTGCAAQIKPEMFAAWPEVDRVVGNDGKMRGEAWGAARTAFDVGADFGIARSEKIAVSDIMAVRKWRRISWRIQRGLPRVFVQVQNGCDHRCTFCISPMAAAIRARCDGRGGQPGARAVERGHAEVVLTGVDLTGYGGDLPGAPKLGTLTSRSCGTSRN